MAKFSSPTYAMMKAQGVPVLQFLNWWYKWHCQWLSWISPVQIKPRKPKWQWQICKGKEIFHCSLKSNAVVRHNKEKIINEATWQILEIKTRIPKQIIMSTMSRGHSTQHSPHAAEERLGQLGCSSATGLLWGSAAQLCSTHTRPRPRNRRTLLAAKLVGCLGLTQPVPDLPTPARTIKKQSIIHIPRWNKTLLIDSEQTQYGNCNYSNSSCWDRMWTAAMDSKLQLNSTFQNSPGRLININNPAVRLKYVFLKISFCFRFLLLFLDFFYTTCINWNNTKYKHGMCLPQQLQCWDSQ